MSTFDRKDVYTRVTERIISDLEQGVRTWMKPLAPRARSRAHHAAPASLRHAVPRRHPEFTS